VWVGSPIISDDAAGSARMFQTSSSLPHLTM
jgi:hypothetical protein